MLIAALEDQVVEKSKAQELTLLLTVGLSQAPGFPLHGGSNASGNCSSAVSFVYGPIPPPRLFLLHPTHRRAGGAVGRDLILLRAALLLGHGAKAILHSPEQDGVQVSILSRGHLND